MKYAFKSPSCCCFHSLMLEAPYSNIQYLPLTIRLLLILQVFSTRLGIQRHPASEKWIKFHKTFLNQLKSFYLFENPNKLNKMKHYCFPEIAQGHWVTAQTCLVGFCWRILRLAVSTSGKGEGDYQFRALYPATSFNI